MRTHAQVDDGTGRMRTAVAGAAGVGAVIVLAAGFAVGRLTSPAGTTAAAPSTSAPGAAVRPGADAAGPIAVLDGVPAGFAHSKAGAIGAATGFIQVEGSDLMAHPDAYRAAWRQMCTPAYFANSGRDAAERVIASQEANNHLVTNATAGQPVYERVFPLAAAATAYADDAATVRVWDLVVAHPGDGPTVLSFSGGTVDLRWSGDWKLDGGAVSSTVADGASGPLVLASGPALPAFLSQLAGSGDATPRS